MPRTAFSVRFPVTLADALDHWATVRRSSRSDLVETIIMATTAEDRDEIRQAAISGAPTEKLNLRLSPTARARLAELAGDLPPADFLRRTVAVLLESADSGPAGHEEAATVISPGSARVRSAESMGTPAYVPPVGIAVLVLAVGFVIWLLVQSLLGFPRSPAPPQDPRGHLDPGTLDGDPE